LQQEIQDLAIARALEENHGPSKLTLDPIGPGVEKGDPIIEHHRGQSESQGVGGRL
jgi:hypothetical protein